MANKNKFANSQASNLINYSFQNVPEAIFWCNFDGEFIYVNDTALNMTGYDKEELISMKISDLNVEVNHNFKELFDKIKNKKKFTFQTKHQHKSGKVYDVEICSNYKIFEGKEIIVGFVKNISDIKLAKEKLDLANLKLKDLLKESEGRFRDLFDEAPIAYVHEGVDSRFIKANQAAISMLGITPEESTSIFGKDLVVDNPENQKRLSEAFKIIEQGADAKGVLLELKRKDNGMPLWVRWWSKPDLSKKFTRTMMIDVTKQILLENEQESLVAENLYLQEEIKYKHNFEEIVSSSKIFSKVLNQIEKVAPTDATVLILGESGTGKELLARAVHNISKRNNRALIKINCSNLPSNLIESELFGHERGAFTGAIERKIGRFELANEGTIFLDEIGEMPIELQAKLLRVLQEGEFERLGNSKTIKVNVRVIAATNRNLKEAIAKNEFREDLFYRLNVFQVVSPPLRNRKEDIPLLVNHFVKKYQANMGREIKSIPDKVINALKRYDWPGNIRELENKIERALITTQGNTLEYGDWIPSLEYEAYNRNGDPISHKLEDVEKEHITSILDKTNWKLSGENGAAKILGLNPNTLYSRMKKLGITK